MKVLIACEESQTVCKAFRKLGHEAFSCDIQECSGGHPEWHIQDDVFNVIQQGWDLMVAHPPCTYLSNAGNRHLYKKDSIVASRAKKGMDASWFFKKLLWCGIKRIAIENPVPNSMFGLPPKSQMIQPYFFGEPFQKKTYLWLKNLPPLMSTCICPGADPAQGAAWFDKGGQDRSKKRSKTWQGIANAMAKQWGANIDTP